MLCHIRAIGRGSFGRQAPRVRDVPSDHVVGGREDGRSTVHQLVPPHVAKVGQTHHIALRVLQNDGHVTAVGPTGQEACAGPAAHQTVAEDQHHACAERCQGKRGDDQSEAPVQRADVHFVDVNLMKLGGKDDAADETCDD